MPAKTTPTPNKPKTIAEVPTQRPPVPVIPLTHDLIADAIGEMLTRGTTDSCLDRVLIAAISHISSRVYAHLDTDEAEIEKIINCDVDHYFRPWKTDILASWRNTRRDSPAAVEPKTVAERIRAEVREDVERQFEEFLDRGTPEEMRFLREVLTDHESRSHLTPLSSDAEMALGQTFDFALGDSRVYLRIPERIADQVQDYVRALRAIEDK